MKKIDVLQKKRPLKILFCYSNQSVVKSYVDYFNGAGVGDSGGENDKKEFEMYGTTSLYRAKTWLAFCNISGIVGGVRRKYLNEEKFRPLRTPYPFDVLVVEYTEVPDEGELTTIGLLENINALGLTGGFLIEREGKESFRPPLTMLAVIDPRAKSPRLLESLMARGVRGVISKPLDEEELKRAIVKAYNDVNVGTKAHLHGETRLEYELQDGSKELFTIVSKSFQTPGSEVEIDRAFQEGSFSVLKTVL